MFKKHSFEACIASVIFIALFFVILIQIFGRTDLFTGPIWTEELARWLWVWMALIGIGAVERNGTHLRMGFLIELLPQKVQRSFALVTDLVYLAIAGQLLWISYKTILRTWRNESVSLPTTDAVLYASAFFALLLIIHRILRRLIAGRNDNSKVEAPL
ncbi:2,3-diketo-L-gulonate TRAP transporter small permease protein YiaM [Roseibium album]|jgi:TRAP-type transport system small permease protein|nr:2,3-diketo-L-gulonate TRAP transporter small permease protein YiaM [Roseibium album]